MLDLWPTLGEPSRSRPRASARPDRVRRRLSTTSLSDAITTRNRQTSLSFVPMVCLFPPRPRVYVRSRVDGVQHPSTDHHDHLIGPLRVVLRLTGLRSHRPHATTRTSTSSVELCRQSPGGPLNIAIVHTAEGQLPRFQHRIVGRRKRIGKRRQTDQAAIPELHG